MFKLRLVSYSDEICQKGVGVLEFYIKISSFRIVINASIYYLLSFDLTCFLVYYSSLICFKSRLAFVATNEQGLMLQCPSY